MVFTVRAKVQGVYRRKDLRVLFQTQGGWQKPTAGGADGAEKVTWPKSTCVYFPAVLYSMCKVSARERTAEGRAEHQNEWVQDVTDRAAGLGFSIALTIICTTGRKWTLGLSLTVYQQNEQTLSPCCSFKINSIILKAFPMTTISVMHY